MEIVEASGAEQISACIDAVIARIKKLERHIAAAGESRSALGVAELQDLQKEYATLVKQLKLSADVKDNC